MSHDDQPIPISALQHWLYCPRQCALIHLEQAWAENKYTAEGRIMHENAHEGADETRSGIRITRGMPVMSEKLGLSGQCDVVEFHKDGTVLCVEYKRGKPKSHRADEVQLCAQAVCLEEMLGCNITSGALYYGQNRRRIEVVFDNELRTLVHSTSQAIKDCFVAGVTPLAEYDARRCDACSLLDFCQPKALRLKRGAATWFSSMIQSGN